MRYIVHASRWCRAFSGHLHEAGAFGHVLLPIALLDVKDASGKAPVFTKDDFIPGQLDTGSSDNDWLDIGMNQFIADNWEAVVTSRIQRELRVNTDAWGVLEPILFGLFLIAVVVLGIGAASCPKGQSWKCGWRPVVGDRSQLLSPGDPGQPPSGVGADYVCECSYD